MTTEERPADDVCPLPPPPTGLRGAARRIAIAMGSGFPSLRHRNYRLFISGQLISMIGAWAQRVAMGWLVYELTDSRAMLGYLGALGAIPMTLLSTTGGLVADRFERRWLIVVTQCLAMVAPALLAVLLAVRPEWVHPWHILVLTLVHGTVMAFDVPARQSFVVQMVGRRNLPNAVALNSAVFNSARAIGPSVGAALYGLFGAAACFAINAATYLCLVAALVMMRLPGMDARGRRSARAGRHPLGGFHFVASRPRMMTSMLLLMAFGIFAWSFINVMPSIAKDDFGVEVTGFGGMLSFYGLGALVGGLVMAYLSHTRRRQRFVLIGGAVSVASLATFGLVPSYALACLAVTGVGMGNLMALVGISGYVQLLVSERFRARVMGVYTFCFVGMMPFGALSMGWASELIGNRPTLLIQSVLLTVSLAGAWASWRYWERHPRPRLFPPPPRRRRVST